MNPRRAACVVGAQGLFLPLAMKTLFPAPLFLAATLAGPTQDADASANRQDSVALDQVLAQSGMRLDADLGVVSIPAAVLVKDDLLEYLLVGPRGAAHESLFVTDVRPSVLNAALLLLGVEPGANARWEPVEDPAPDGEEGRVVPPAGDGFLLYAAWREDEEIYFFRVEDLLSNLETGRSMRRHRWVFLGSRFHAPREGEPEVFVADVEQNLINVAFFFQGNTLLTAALPECLEQTIWVANPWLLPPRDTRVALLFARRALSHLPDGWEEAVPRAPARDEANDAR